MPEREVEVPIQPSIILIIFPEGPHTTGARVEYQGEVDLGQMQIAADMVKRQVDDAFKSLGSLLEQQKRKGKIVLPGLQ